MLSHFLHRRLKSIRGLVTAEFAGGFDEAGGLLTLWRAGLALFGHDVRRAVWIADFQAK